MIKDFQMISGSDPRPTILVKSDSARINSLMGRGVNRAAHIHFIVKAPDYETAITHVFPPDCPYIDNDAVFGVKESLVGDFRGVDDPAEAEKLGFESPFWSLDWDFVLPPEQQKI